MNRKKMSDDLNILGIDIGSVAIAISEISPEREIIKTAYQFHHGNIPETFTEIINEFPMDRISGTAATSSTPSNIRTAHRYDNRLAVIAAARHFHKDIGAILVVGGETFSLITFKSDGSYQSFRANTSCAAGTGSFLDQQARRLNLRDTKELSDRAFSNSRTIPGIASRCAVFAKTDLVHAQQEGYTLEQICDGLCHGLARNITDTLSMDRDLPEPVIFTGGVSRNRSVVKHIRSITGKEILPDETGVYGAIGAAFLMAHDYCGEETEPCKLLNDPVNRETFDKKYFHEPLMLNLSEYPDFDGIEHYEYQDSNAADLHSVEVDIYRTLTPLADNELLLGLDVGSTSTKAVLLDRAGEVLAGFYTGTAGRPVAAVQRLFSSIADMSEKKKAGIRITGAASTGAGRKFAGKIMGADIVIDEISAHARAAREIDPDVDTIIEIGGQDSKFTTLKNGMVTFSIMNNVCAAGTGSFIEEQARKLNCPLAEYSKRAEGCRSPIVSDRCTVFMERDMNHYLSEGYSVDEVLASVLHAIRENYLTKVAVESSIGNRIFFQGATAKNRALVSAFEQRLEKPIHVSRYCHLTGAWGAALTLLDEFSGKTGFRGIDLCEKNIEVTSETCELCTNHCKITVADVEGEKVAYGFLCGRDYDTKQYIEKNLSGFDLLKERKKVFSFDQARPDSEITVGIPAGLHMHEDIGFWRFFFNELSIGTVTSEGCKDALREGKHIAGAEFCAPMAALYGHVSYLIERADYVFLPFYLDKKPAEKGVRRQYCYYTQFSPSLITLSGDEKNAGKILTPLVNSIHDSLYTKTRLHLMLKSITKHPVGFIEVSRAYDRASEYKKECLDRWKEIYEKENRKTDKPGVMLLGRPYTVMSKFMNKGIPGIFASLGIRVFFQDMLSYPDDNGAFMEGLLREMHWNYASEILRAAHEIARTRGVYPVFITSFRCSPDSFAIDYFKKIMESFDKPYLILQLDEHESSVGYETRIEAAIRSFENHFSGETERPVVPHTPHLFPVNEKGIQEKTLVIPCWDDITLKFVTANLMREGIDARLMTGSEANIQKGLRHNTGQCIPVNIIARDFIDYVKAHDLDPEKTLLWMISSKIACNIGLFPLHLKSLFNSHGKGMEKAGVYAGNLSFIDISLKLPINSYFAYMFGGFIRKMGCRIRPYEKNRGITDRVLRKSVDILLDAFLGNRPKEEALKEVIARFESIEITRERKPKVAIFGDLYVRDNDLMNQDLIGYIEKHDAEVIVTPYSSYVQMIEKAYIKKWFFEGRYLDVLSSKALMSVVRRMEKVYYRYFGRILDDPAPVYDESPERILKDYNLRVEHTGESMDNLLKIHYLKKHHPDISLFVQTSPAFCCPSLVTEAMAKAIEKKTGVPIVSITYDGTHTNRNEAILPYLSCL